ncbi:MAG TPA: hypothetical protein DHU56_11475 [Marinobacter sp.]|jgi:hypothetical protein|nr:hypothetical protein [Marinobacter sp.]
MNSKTTLPFEPSATPFGMYGAPDCCLEKAKVSLRRTDNLGQPLRFTKPGILRHANGQEHSGTLQQDAEDRDNYLARFEKVTVGKAWWHWPEEPAGEHLIGFDTVSRKDRFAPGQTLDEGVRLDVIQGERKATAIHLPPPVIINLREDSAPQDDKLTPEQLAYFRANGNNAMIFVHGYNVPHGEWGRFLKGDSRSPHWHGNTRSFSRVPKWHPYKAMVKQDPQALSDGYPFTLEDADVNGSGVQNWAIHMEYCLNKAAGFDGTDWMPFSRIINISWPGDTGSTDFMQAELNAMTAGRRLVPLLQQLQDAGIAVNLITHSLGARVALTALNILGTTGRHNLVDHLFLWQPAVADNALSNDPERDAHPFGLGVFPAAHKAARQIVVLHSKGDGVLGPDERYQKSWWQQIADFWSSVATDSLAGPLNDVAHDILSADDWLDEATGHVHGAYDKKWWTFPSFLDNGFGPAIEKLYKDYLPLTYDEDAGERRRGYPAKQRRRLALQSWERLEKDILAEAQSLWQPCIDCLRNGERPPRYTLLAPLNHRASISLEVARDYIQRLRKLAVNNWQTEQPPRPALGYMGFEEVADNPESPHLDLFIQEKRNIGVFQVVNQSEWLFSHSGMKIPSKVLFEEIFKREIMQNRLLKQSGFGRY